MSSNTVPPAGGFERQLKTLQTLLTIPCGDLATALTHAADAVAEALHADKVDAFLYDEHKDTLVAVGTSVQPLSNLQKSLGLDVLPVSNGGRVVYVYKTGKTFVTGHLLDDPGELIGVKEGLKIQSKIGVPLTVGGQRRGMMMIASLQEEFFTEQDVQFAELAVEWVATIVHRAQLLTDAEATATEQGRKLVAEELITVAAHDLRHYLSPISLRLYALRQIAEQNGHTEYVGHVNAALTSTKSLSELVTNILDVARLDQGLYDISPEPLDLVEMAREVSTVLSTPQHKIDVKSSIPAIVMADPARLRQCLDNVIANAVSHSPDDATVSIVIGQEKTGGTEFAAVEIVDEGPGIPEHIRESLFERFVTKRQSSGGLGLGLYLAKRVAVAHGGDLKVDNSPGHGARFALRVPLQSPEALKTEDIPSPRK